MTNNKNDIKRNYTDSAFGIALYILRCIDEGQSSKEIIQTLNNGQLATVWIRYLKGVSWLKEDTQGNLMLSEDGKSRIKQNEKVILELQDTNTLSRHHH
jgi:hypothetical protein